MCDEATLDYCYHCCTASPPINLRHKQKALSVVLVSLEKMYFTASNLSSWKAKKKKTYQSILLFTGCIFTSLSAIVCCIYETATGEQTAHVLTFIRSVKLYCFIILGQTGIRPPIKGHHTKSLTMTEATSEWLLTVRVSKQHRLWKRRKENSKCGIYVECWR